MTSGPTEEQPASESPIDASGIFHLEPHGKDVWVGESPPYAGGRIFGGLTIAQSLWAATLTVTDEHALHSMHAYFILGGDVREPVRYEVDRIRNGRSFTTRRVVARQSGGAIFTLESSFQRYEDGVETQTASFPSHIGPPTDYEVDNQPTHYDRALVPQTPDPVANSWVRFRADLPNDPRVHACALGYLSDSSAMRAVHAAHPDSTPGNHPNFMSASLDHSMWFHRPVRADDWLLLAYEGQGILRTRGLALGNVFSIDGVHLASIAQEGLVRERR